MGILNILIQKVASRISRQPSIASSPSPDKEPVAKVTLPYVRGISEPICRILKQVNIEVGFRPYHTLHQLLMKPKDVTPIEARSGVVYRIPCMDCEKTYVGQTKRSLQLKVQFSLGTVLHRP